MGVFGVVCMYVCVRPTPTWYLKRTGLSSVRLVSGIARWVVWVYMV